HEVTQDGWVPGMHLNGRTNGFGNLFTHGSFTQKLDVFFPGKRHQHAHPGGSTTIKKPPRRRMVYPHNIKRGLTHKNEIASSLLRSSEVISFCVGLERSVGHAFNKKLLVSFKKEFRQWANS